MALYSSLHQGWSASKQTENFFGFQANPRENLAFLNLRDRSLPVQPLFRGRETMHSYCDYHLHLQADQLYQSTLHPLSPHLHRTRELHHAPQTNTCL